MTGELADAAFLLRTGWTWQMYMDCPFDIIQNMFILLEAEASEIKRREREAHHG